MAAITSGEILFKRSVKTGAAGNSVAQADPNASLGKYISTTAWAGSVANDLFDDISGAENAANTVDYRCIFVHNSNASNALQNTVVYISAETAGGASIALATDNIAATPIAQAGAQAAEIANENATPSGVSAFSSPTTLGTGLSMGNIPSANCRAFWIRRTAANTVALSNDGVTITVGGDTGSL